MTWGIGMTFFHELGHTYYGGLKTDPQRPINNQFYQANERIRSGENETLMNRIRRQLGGSWGRRLSYYDVGPNGFMPFSKEALKRLKNGLSPTGQYIQTF